MRIVIAGLLCCMLASLAIGDARCETDPGIRQFVEHWEAAAKAIKSRASGGDTQIAAGCSELTGAAFDFDALLRESIPGTWTKLKPAQRTTLAAAVAKRATTDCVDHIQDYDGSPFAILGVRVADDGDRLVTANVRSAGGRNVHVTWRLRAADLGHWTAVDLIVEGRSMTARIRSEFNQILTIRNGNLTATIDTMARR
ncbi:MAG: ABC transporter substrate-binding protein [Proteobacteria bacterium]|nr:ABC transporter substrate-binding protein [Pseudomonadota bacterium]